jgi:chemotaxis protein CheX
MDVKIINAFLDGTISVIKTMSFIEPKSGSPYLKKDAIARGDISGIIGLAGSFKGSLALSFDRPCILEIVSSMLGEEIAEINADINDAVGEITNMVSGAARKNMEAAGFTILSGLPTVISGKNHQITHVMGGPSIIIPFQTAKGVFVVDICISEASLQ